jgi:hypothetical protein
MTALLPPTMLVHDEPVNVAGTGQKAFYQPENLVDLSVLSERGAKFTLDVHGIHGSSSWRSAMSQVRASPSSIGTTSRRNRSPS